MGTDLGDYLRRRRKERDLGLREMATKAGVSPSYLSRIESGDETHPPSEDALRRFADVLCETPDVFMQLAGRISKDVTQYVASTPNLADFLRKARERGYGSADFARLAKEVSKKGGEDDGE